MSRSRASCGTGYRCIFGFLWFTLSWKWGQELGKLSAIKQVLTIWGQLLQGLRFGFLGWLW